MLGMIKSAWQRHHGKSSGWTTGFPKKAGSRHRLPSCIPARLQPHPTDREKDQEKVRMAFVGFLAWEERPGPAAPWMDPWWDCPQKNESLQGTEAWGHLEEIGSCHQPAEEERAWFSPPPSLFSLLSLAKAVCWAGERLLQDFSSLGLAEPHEEPFLGSSRSFWARPGPCGWHPSPEACGTLCSAWCHLQAR